MTTWDDHETALATLVADAVADVEPGDALAALRARTRPPSRRRWVLPTLGAAVVAAAVVVAVAVVGNDQRPSAEPEPAPSVPTASETSPSPSLPPVPAPTPRSVYFVGDTVAGPRLYRETAGVGSDNPVLGVLQVLAEDPQDPDYRRSWPSGSFEDATFDGVGRDGFFSVTLSDPALAQRPPGMTDEEASLAVEAVVRSLQDAFGRARVEFYAPGSTEPLDTVLGIAAQTDPDHDGVRFFDRSPDLDVLSLILLDQPIEGDAYLTGDTLSFSGEAAAFEGNVQWRLQRYEGTEVIDQGFVTAEGADGFYPFHGEVDLTGVPAGRYTFMVWTDDPSGEGNSFTDSRVITVE